MKKKCLRCWFCRKIIREDVSQRGNAIKIPIWHPHPTGSGSLIHLIIPEPIHRRCRKSLLNALREERKKVINIYENPGLWENK